MQFLEDGADIPNGLIKAVTDGEVTFLCGAGVSYRVGLPSFKQLATLIYQRLGESPEAEAAERHAMRRGEYDRALRSLEKRTCPPRAASPVRNVIAELLTTGVTEFPDHLALLKLSRDNQGRPRLLTTNFDTLFERAAEAGNIQNVPSHSTVSIPRAGGQRDYGILHLHGRVDTDIILTSADFGDAYLRNGWASRYIEDRMRLGTLVLVGYGAEDSAMRLLLETLDADRGRFRDLHDIYVIERHKPESASLWKAKGIKPIEFASYDSIYATLAEWARYAMQPDDYRRERIKSILE